MKKMVVIDYWLMLIAWCLFLNGAGFTGEVLMIVGIMLMLGAGRLDYLRITVSSMICFIIMTVLLKSSRIPYFYPALSIHLLLASINCFTLNEYLIRLDSRFIIPVILVIVLSVLFISGLIIIIPGEYYSMIGKSSLFLLEAFIFLPYLASSLICVVSKQQ